MIKPIVLIVLDGWGIAPPGPGNAITLAQTPNYLAYSSVYPHGKLQASGEAVGLPHNEIGSSHTGHLNLGAGRIIYQDLPRINMSIADGSFFKISSLIKAIEHAKNNKSNLHLIGLVGQGGVHSSSEHLYAILRLCKDLNFNDVYLDLFTDGRDSPPNSSLIYVVEVIQQMKSLNVGKISTLMGRFYGMDRDNHWDRTEKAYKALTKGQGGIFNNPEVAILKSYEEGKTDEFLEPVILTDENGQIYPRIKDNDSVIFFNFRIDRPRQLTKAFVLPDLKDIEGKKTSFDPFTEKYYKKTYIEDEVKGTFDRGEKIDNLYFTTMTEYEKGLPVEVIFPPIEVENPLGQILSERGMKQLRITESEKERFVTFYFNGQRENPFPGEDRIIIPSPAVTSYDQKPEMSILELTDTIIKKVNEKIYDFILINFPNPDMVGHTGVLEAGIRACSIVDKCLGNVVNAITNVGGVTIITADHGNIEEMINLKTGQADTEHSTNPVPFLIVGEPFIDKKQMLASGILADVAPTILSLYNIKIPDTMSGRKII